MHDKTIKIGIDFDNTLVDYDFLFYKIANDKGLIPESTHKNKTAVRDYLRKIGKEEEWTRMQGEAYGKRILEASAFEGAESFLQECAKRGVETYIISHKTKHPFIGEQVDLHEWARKWLDANGFSKYVSQDNIFFELTKEEKIKRIKDLGCDYFIDDLPEFLSLDGLQKNIRLVLFDPSNAHKENKLFKKAAGWQEVENFTMAHAFVTKLLSSIGYAGDIDIERITGGRNNKVWKITLKGREPLLLKAYFYSKQDTRDRFGIECSFLKYASSKTSRIPKLYAMDEKSKTSLMQFASGKKAEKGNITKNMIEQAAQFIKEINDGARDKNLPVASESSFCINSHINNVDARLRRLEQVQSDSLEFKEFVMLLRQNFKKKSDEVQLWCEQNKQPADEQLLENERIVSPSDFGFHNALIDEHGKITFLDFEYAGWDDPAKLICDFFCQPDIPVPKEHYEYFAKMVSGDTKTLQRAKILMPLYEIRWAGIMLNEFLKADAERRQFANGKSENAATTQLDKAMAYYQEKSRTN